MSAIRHADSVQGLEAWQQFLIDHGWRARATHLSAVLDRHVDEIEGFRRLGVMRRLEQPLDFPELYRLWNGRDAAESDWPPPDRAARGSYEWQAPELALLAILVGQISTEEIAEFLTARLRENTGDDQAERNKTAVLVRMNAIGLQSTDVVGGITISTAEREAGSYSIVYHAIESGQLAARRIGRLWVIPHEAWAAFKATRSAPPEGYVRLAAYREALGMNSDKLPEFARMGYVPTAVQCNPFGGGPSTQFGTWYVDRKVIEEIVADRHAGRPMPWHGKPLLDNLRTTYRLWRERRHPAECQTCRHIWGDDGPPEDFDSYMVQYPSIDKGAKRHLTMRWNPGLPIEEVAKQCGCQVALVRDAIEAGVLASTERGGRPFVSRTDATRWKARRCPSGQGERSWISVESATKQYLFTAAAIHAHIAAGRLTAKLGDAGAARGITYVLKQQCAQLRERLGFDEVEAARRVGVTVERLRSLLEGVNWRGAPEGIPLDTIRAVIKRLQSREGYSLDEAAERLLRPLSWVKARVADGTVRVSRAPWDQRRLYLSQPMFDRLIVATVSPTRRIRLNEQEWLGLERAALEAGVSTGTLGRWGKDGELDLMETPGGTRYRLASVRARARSYWKTARWRRPALPTWLREELEGCVAAGE